MINFDSKISGTRVTGSEIDEIMQNIIFASQFISLKDCIKKIHRQESMNWILDILRFYKGQYAGDCTSVHGSEVSFRHLYTSWRRY